MLVRRNSVAVLVREEFCWVLPKVLPVCHHSLAVTCVPRSTLLFQIRKRKLEFMFFNFLVGLDFNWDVVIILEVVLLLHFFSLRKFKLEVSEDFSSRWSTELVLRLCFSISGYRTGLDVPCWSQFCFLLLSISNCYSNQLTKGVSHQECADQETKIF